MLGIAEYMLVGNSLSNMERVETCFHRTVHGKLLWKISGIDCVKLCMFVCDVVNTAKLLKLLHSFNVKFV
jgi:hypothetical protein